MSKRELILLAPVWVLLIWLLQALALFLLWNELVVDLTGYKRITYEQSFVAIFALGVITAGWRTN